jgi:3-methyladenine DNA glycosylase AlkD
MSDRGAFKAEVLADELDCQIRALPEQKTEPIRRVRREFSIRLRTASFNEVLAVADALVDRQRWVAYELLYFHRSRLSGLDIQDVERLGRGLDSWEAVDAFARYISGPAWQRGLIPDDSIHGWAASPDRFWRRAALVSTVPLNLRAAGGTGDTRRTLDICTRLVADTDDTVVKALSWALRELAIWDPDTVSAFLDTHKDVLASRIKREVRNKLETGLKNPGRREQANEE